jgi:DNA polymerase-3 subunit beta
MKLTITKEQILNGLQAVQNIVGPRTTLPVLSNILLQAEEGRLRLTATDLDVTLSCVVSAQVERPGATTLPAKKLVSISREVGGPELEFEVDERHHCQLRSAASYYKIHGLAPEEFPTLAEFGDQPKTCLPQVTLRAMLRKTAFAASADESRYVLNGILLSLQEHKLTIVATDGRRLALVEEEIDVLAESRRDMIVPTKAVNELTRLLQDAGQAELRSSPNQAAFELIAENGLSTRVVTKLVDGTYPNYKQVIPSETRERITLPREELLHALRRAEIMTSDKSNSVKLAFSQNNLSITANTPEVGEARESLAIAYKGQDIAIAFNPAFLIDPLKALETDDVFLDLIDELSPGLLKINGPYLYVIMPMRMT